MLKGKRYSSLDLPEFCSTVNLYANLIHENWTQYVALRLVIRGDLLKVVDFCEVWLVWHFELSPAPIKANDNFAINPMEVEAGSCSQWLFCFFVGIATNSFYSFKNINLPWSYTVKDDNDVYYICLLYAQVPSVHIKYSIILAQCKD